MKSLKTGQRVMVRTIPDPNGEDDLPIHAPGTVGRPRRADNGYWIALDKRSPTPGAHPFPEDATAGRGTHVLAYPEDCEAL